MSSPFATTSKTQQTTHTSSNHSSQLPTPNGTPPTSANRAHQPHPFADDSKLHQLLANFDNGTHSFDRTERETPEERGMSFGEGFPTPPSSRRASVLSSLSLTRPGFGFSSNPSSGFSSPIPSPHSSSHLKDAAHHLPSGLAMTTTHTIDQQTDLISRPKSTPTVPLPQPAEHVSEQKQAPQMQRSQTAPQGHVKVAGFPLGSMIRGKVKTNQNNGIMGGTGEISEKRHFDPSKEPRLLGLL